MSKRAAILDDGRPAAVAKQRAKGRWTARERVDALLDADSLTESGAFAEPLAAGLSAPADGVITGIGTVGGAAVAVVAYDYTALGGTQGQISHRKLEHLFAAAARERCPVVIFAEGGGARWQELEPIPGGGTTSFVDLARLSRTVPVAAAITGHAFAGHANLAALCDLVVATADATMGIGGPPLVEAALGVAATPQEIGPMSLHQRTGAVDLVVADDEAVLVALRRWLRLVTSSAAGDYKPKPVDGLRSVVPVNPRHAYDVRAVISLIADPDSIFEVRDRFAANVVTAFIEVGGLRAGVIANQPRVLAGAIDSNGSDKMARFISLCDALGVPILFLIDTPGFMVGAPAEQTALVRHSARVLQTLAAAEVPIISVVLRKAYGLAYYAMGSPPFGP
ncbi:MAG TPA: carboxyl transferase domain-containing protein, partial [Micromonosporaceae bacterium]